MDAPGAMSADPGGRLHSYRRDAKRAREKSEKRARERERKKGKEKKIDRY